MKLSRALKVGSIFVVVVALPCIVVMSLPFTYDEMDLNKDGILGFSEVTYFFDYGEREIAREGRTCTEYYALKDGLPLKVVCHDSEF